MRGPHHLPPPPPQPPPLPAAGAAAAAGRKQRGSGSGGASHIRGSTVVAVVVTAGRLLYNYNPLRLLLAVIVALLQNLVLMLEYVIETLGHEPERRWERAAFLQGMSWKPPSTDALVKRAQQLAEQGEADQALKLYVKVLEAEPENTTVMDATAELLAELGEAQSARELLMRSIQLQPDAGAGKFILLGHLTKGSNAIASFEHAVRLLTTELDRTYGVPGEEGEAQKRSIQLELSSVMAAVAKVYLTDCFHERESQAQCEQLLDQALLYNPDCPEATQALADFRLSQSRRGEALVLVRRTVDICRKLAREGMVPSYDFRTVTARLLVELSQYDTAARLLEELAGEDEEDVEVWYLLGLCNMLLDRPKPSRTALNTAKQLIERSHSSDFSLLDQINSLLSRRSIGEHEKQQHFWNPRRWTRGDGHATSTSLIIEESEHYYKTSPAATPRALDREKADSPFFVGNSPRHRDSSKQGDNLFVSSPRSVLSGRVLEVSPTSSPRPKHLDVEIDRRPPI